MFVATHESRKTQNPTLKTQNHLWDHIEPKIRSLLSAIVIGLWVAVLLGVWLRIGLNSHSHDVFVTYYDAGRKWIAVAIALFLHKRLCLQSAKSPRSLPCFRGCRYRWARYSGA